MDAIIEKCQAMRTAASCPFDSERRFWMETSNNESNATLLAAGLIAYLAAVETGEDKASTLADIMKRVSSTPANSRAPANDETAHLRDSLIKSLSLLALFRPYNVTNASLRAAASKLGLLKSAADHQPSIDTVSVEQVPCAVNEAGEALLTHFVLVRTVGHTVPINTQRSQRHHQHSLLVHRCRLAARRVDARNYSCTIS
jgi:hypothetical protein